MRVIKYPYLVKEFKVLGITSDPLVVESTTIPLNKGTFGTVWYKGIKKKFPIANDSPGTWTCTVVEDGGLNIITDIITRWVVSGNYGFPIAFNAFHSASDTISICLGDNLMVTLRGVYISGIDPVNLSSTDATTPLKWNISFEYDRVDLTLQSSDVQVKEVSAVTSKTKTEVQSNEPVRLAIAKTVYQAKTNLDKLGSLGAVSSDEQARILASLNKKNWLRTLTESVNSVNESVQAVTQRARRDLNSVRSTISDVRSIKSNVDQVSTEFTKRGTVYRSISQAKRTIKRTNWKDLDSILSSADTVVTSASRVNSSVSQSSDLIANSANTLNRRLDPHKRNERNFIHDVNELTKKYNNSK